VQGSGPQNYCVVLNFPLLKNNMNFLNERLVVSEKELCSMQTLQNRISLTTQKHKFKTGLPLWQPIVDQQIDSNIVKNWTQIIITYIFIIINNSRYNSQSLSMKKPKRDIEGKDKEHSRWTKY